MKKIIFVLLILLIPSIFLLPVIATALTKDSMNVNGSTADAQETGGTVTVNGHIIVIGNVTDVVYNGGFYFKFGSVPDHWICDSAFFWFYNKTGLASNYPVWNIYGHDTDNSVGFSAENFTTRTKTTAKVTWTLGTSSASTWIKSPDIKAVIQEIRDRAGFTAANYFTLLVYDTASATSKRRNVVAYDSLDAVTLAPYYIGYYTAPPVVQTIVAIDTNKTSITIQNTWTGGVSVDTLWLFWDNDATIAGAESTYTVTGISSPDTLWVSNLTANTEYNFWGVASSDAGRDTSTALTRTTLNVSQFFGDSTSVTTAITVEDTIKGSTYLCDSTGVIDSAVSRIVNYGATKNWKIMVYKESDKSLVGTSDVVSKGDAIQVSRTAFPFTVKPNVVAGTKYILSIWCESDLTFGSVRSQICKGDSNMADVETYGTPPNPFAPIVITANRRVIIWAYVTTAISGPPRGMLSSKYGIGLLSYKGGICLRNIK